MKKALFKFLCLIPSKLKVMMESGYNLIEVDDEPTPLAALPRGTNVALIAVIVCMVAIAVCAVTLMAVKRGRMAARIRQLRQQAGNEDMNVAWSYKKMRNEISELELVTASAFLEEDAI